MSPTPALVVDLRWNLVAANAAVAPLLDGVDARSTGANRSMSCGWRCIRRGLAPRIANLAEVARNNLLERLRRQVELNRRSGADRDPWPRWRPIPVPAGARPAAGGLRRGGRAVSNCCWAIDCCRFLSTTTVFGAAGGHHALGAVAGETFFPADAATAEGDRGQRLGRAGGRQVLQRRRPDRPSPGVVCGFSASLLLAASLAATSASAKVLAALEGRGGAGDDHPRRLGHRPTSTARATPTRSSAMIYAQAGRRLALNRVETQLHHLVGPHRRAEGQAAIWKDLAPEAGDRSADLKAKYAQAQPG